MTDIFREENYGFMDSIITDIKLDKNMFDYLITVDYFLGKEGYSTMIFRLKNVKKFSFNMTYKGTRIDTVSPYTLAHISKTKKGELMEFVAEIFPEHKDDEPLIYCLCEEVYIEK